MITAYLYMSCSSCRKAKDVLDASGADYTVREFFKARVTREELEGLMKATGLTVADILSTRSTPYRELNLAERELTDDELLDLMVQEPRLLKRPILVSGADVVVGYSEGKITDLVAKDATR